MNKERLSQLIDGELDAQEIESALDELLASPKMQHSWRSIHLARTVMHPEKGGELSINVAEKVAVALENEPTIMAPNNISVEQNSPKPADNIVPLHNNWPKAWAFTAIAASVAALVFLSYTPNNEQTTPAIADSNIGATQSNVDMELQSMIVQHGEFSGAAALNGLAAYAKVVNGSSGEY